HLNLLKSVENVFLEESVLFQTTWAHGGLCFAPKADKYLSRLAPHPNLKLIDSTLPPPFHSSLQHPYAIQNAALAVAVAQSLGLSSEAIQKGLNNLILPEGRGRERRIRPDLL